VEELSAKGEKFRKLRTGRNHRGDRRGGGNVKRWRRCAGLQRKESEGEKYLKLNTTQLKIEPSIESATQSPIAIGPCPKGSEEKGPVAAKVGITLPRRGEVDKNRDMGRKRKKSKNGTVIRNEPTRDWKVIGYKERREKDQVLTAPKRGPNLLIAHAAWHHHPILN